MRAAFDDARNNVPHRGEAGGEGEAILREFLSYHLPRRYGVTGGFIIDSRDVVSPQTDVIVYDAFNCPVYRTSERGMIIPSDNAAAVVEVKFTLTTSLFGEALSKIHDVKRLAKTRLTSEDGYAAQYATFGAIFAFSSEAKPQALIDRWTREMRGQVRPELSCNAVVLLDRGLIVAASDIPSFGVRPAMLGPGLQIPGTRLGLTFMEHGENTLDAFLRFLLAHLTLFRHRVDHPGFDSGPFRPDAITWFGSYDQSGRYVEAGPATEAQP